MIGQLMIALISSVIFGMNRDRTSTFQSVFGPP